MLKRRFAFFGMILALSSIVSAWTAGNITVDVVNSPMNIKVSAGAKTLLEITGIRFGGTNYTTLYSVEPNGENLVKEAIKGWQLLKRNMVVMLCRVKCGLIFQLKNGRYLKKRTGFFQSTLNRVFNHG